MSTNLYATLYSRTKMLYVNTQECQTPNPQSFPPRLYKVIFTSAVCLGLGGLPLSNADPEFPASLQAGAHQERRACQLSALQCGWVQPGRAYDWQCLLPTPKMHAEQRKRQKEKKKGGEKRLQSNSIIWSTSAEIPSSGPSLQANLLLTHRHDL